MIFLTPIDKPFNPLINSGALLSSSLLLQLVRPELDDLARKYEFVMEIFEVTSWWLKTCYSQNHMLSIIYRQPPPSGYLYYSFYTFRKWPEVKLFNSTTPYIWQRRAQSIEISHSHIFWEKTNVFLPVPISRKSLSCTSRYISTSLVLILVKLFCLSLFK